MPLAACPSQEQLSGYVLGLLDESRCEAIAEHVEVCVACEATVQRLEDRPDTVVGQLRTLAPPDPYAAESACAQAVARIEALVGTLAAAGATTPEGTALAPGGTLRE
jgi:anti-sigma factor RsiW